MVRKAGKKDIQALLDDESKPIFVFDDGQVLGHAFCMITLNVWEGNDPALSFYRNMGMKVQKTTMEIIL